MVTSIRRGCGTSRRAVIERLEARQLLAADSLTPSLTRLVLPDLFIPGDKGAVVITVNNTGENIARGRLKFELIASMDDSISDDDVPLPTPKLASVAIGIAPGKSKAIGTSFLVPSSMPTGTFKILARISPVETLTDEQVSDSPAISTISKQAVHQFGNVGTRRGVKLSRIDADGTLVTYMLSGPGTGRYSIDSDGNVDIFIDRSTLATSFVVATRGGRNIDKLTSIDDLVVQGIIAQFNGPLRTISAATTSITGSLEVGDVFSIRLNDISGGNTLLLRGTAPLTMLVGNVRNTLMLTSAPLRALVVKSWTHDAGTISALDTPWIGALKCLGDWSAGMVIRGFDAPRGMALGSAMILGNLSAGPWMIGGDAKAIAVRGSVADSSSVSVAGRLTALAVTGDFAGDLAAGNITAAKIVGSTNGARILAGTNFGADGVFGNGDPYAAGEFRSLVVLGSAVSSIFAAGVDPIDEMFDDNDSILPGGVIRAIAVRGTVSDDSRFKAAILPRFASINRMKIETAGSPFFKS